MSLGDLYLEGLIHGGAYFRNFTVLSITRVMMMVTKYVFALLLLSAKNSRYIKKQKFYFLFM